MVRDNLYVASLLWEDDRAPGLNPSCNAQVRGDKIGSLPLGLVFYQEP